MNFKLKYIKLIYYFLTPQNNYLRVGLFLLITFSFLSIYLNLQGFNCLSELSRYYNNDSDIVTNSNIQSIEDVELKCFIVTNLYVYSIFITIIGIILILFYYFKKRKNN